MERITLTFKDAKNPGHVSANARGMEAMLRRWIQKTELVGQFAVSFLTMNRNILPEKGIKLVSHDRMALRIKIWADVLPTECLLFPPKNISAENVYSLLASGMGEKRFISQEALSRDQKEIRNPNPIEEAFNLALAAKKIKTPAPSVPEESRDDAKPFSLKALLDSTDEKAIYLDSLRRLMDGNRMVSSTMIGEVVLSVYKIAAAQTQVAPLVGNLIRQGYLEKAEKFRYRLTLLTDMFLHRNGLLAEAEVVQELPPLLPPPQESPSSPPPPPLRSDAPTPIPPVPRADTANPLIGNVTKLQSVIAEMEAVTTALAACSERVAELERQRAELDQQLAEVRREEERFRTTLADEKYARAQRLLKGIAEFQ